jgi:hypothetical protein
MTVRSCTENHCCGSAGVLRTMITPAIVAEASTIRAGAAAPMVTGNASAAHAPTSIALEVPGIAAQAYADGRR